MALQVNIPLGPGIIIGLVIIAALISLVIYRDAKNRGVEHPVLITIAVFLALFIGIIPGLIAITLYWYFRDSLVGEGTETSTEDSP
jgi:hypothetical protein